ncbi:MAG: succinate dehydrogenase cytochrome b subunit [Chlorobi bacterium]|nr:succinate dehydrogenase cytochrome b subunit [Chlorobiota bacterium]
MSNFLFASIGKKFIMSISGIFLFLFISVHLTVNLLLIFDDSGELFNLGAHFMATNLIIKIVEPILGLGFVVHILWSLVLSYQNFMARPIGYLTKSRSVSSTWASRNMLILGSLVLVFLVIHIINFFWDIKFNPGKLNTVYINGGEIEDTYTLVASLFKASVIYDILYIIGGILLGIHLSHGFWSSFQTLGLNNRNWMKRLQRISYIYAVIIATGFAIIPLYFLIKF